LGVIEPVAAIFAFKCGKCSKIHEGSPSFSYDAPWRYLGLSTEEKAAAELKSDTCVIRHDDGVDRFIRVVLEIPIHGVDEPFMWGVWVSLSEKSFARYLETWNEPDESDAYFGWFCSRLPYYEDTINLKAQVRPRRGGLRPYLELERNGHLLAEHLFAGISIEHAQEIAEMMMHEG
jgi:hypothetical protein